MESAPQTDQSPLTSWTLIFFGKTTLVVNKKFRLVWPMYPGRELMPVA